ncbi:MAG: hypothetical protein BGO21_31220 [Dyadobacter sp. 50-39]|mgnify:FL=1|nr:MAG: hypothetical protein BGO21_31220 [Dyadobacter sp. 50-39]
MYLAIAWLFPACKEKEVDAPEITVLSPKSHQVIKDKDSVRIEATVKPSNTWVTSYTLTVKNKHNKLIFNAQRGCDCKSLTQVEIKQSFLYEVDKTSDLLLEIEALLGDGRKIREQIPFVIAN